MNNPSTKSAPMIRFYSEPSPVISSITPNMMEITHPSYESSKHIIIPTSINMRHSSLLELEIVDDFSRLV